jgi:RNA polymerase sigma-70 factor (ECF subfamily)
MTHSEVAEAYRKYGHLVLRRCRAILRDDDAAAADMLQETFVRLWRYGDAFRAAEAKLSWLHRVAERCCFDLLAQRGSRAEEPLETAGERPAVAHGDALEDRQLVLRFLERFDDLVKQVAVLHYLDEMTQEEIAAATGWSRQTVIKKLAFLRERAAALRGNLYGERRRT